MPACRKALAQLKVVVNLTVEDDNDGAIFVENRLSTALYIDDTQATAPQPDAGIDERSDSIGPTVRESAYHGIEEIFIHAIA